MQRSQKSYGMGIVFQLNKYFNIEEVNKIWIDTTQLDGFTTVQEEQLFLTSFSWQSPL
jgi:hypothetical protein